MHMLLLLFCLSAPKASTRDSQSLIGTLTCHQFCIYYAADEGSSASATHWAGRPADMLDLSYMYWKWEASPPCRGAIKQTHTYTVSHLTAAMAIPCMNLTVAASRVFQFKVEGYSFTKGTVKSEREYYQSDAFRVGGQDWAVRYYPNPQKGGPGNNIKVGLVLVSRPIEVISVGFTLTLLCKSGVPSGAMKAVTATDVNRVPVNHFWYGPKEVLSFVVGLEPIAEFLVDDSFVLHSTVSLLKRPAAA
jgi:hypothetical protein